MDLTKILEWAGTAIAAIVAAGVVIKIAVKNRSDKNKVIQKNNTVHGDMAGRDVRKP